MMENTMQQAGAASRGLSGTALKLVALVCMVLDHIHYFFAFTGAVPVWFSMAGRLAAPLFTFCLAEGFAHTHSRRRYFLRVAAVAVPMGALRFFMQYGGVLVRPDGFYPANAVFTDFLVFMLLWQALDWLRTPGRRALGGLLASGVLAWPLASAWVVLRFFPGAETALGLAWYTVLPAWTAGEGGLPYLLGALAMYAFRRRRAIQLAAWGAVTFLYWVVYLGTVLAGQGMPLTVLFTEAFEWMQLFAIPLLLLYNGQRGRGLKGLFYTFYPAHVYILYALSWLVYSRLF